MLPLKERKKCKEQEVNTESVEGRNKIKIKKYKMVNREAHVCQNNLETYLNPYSCDTKA